MANPSWCEFSFSLVSLWGFPRKWASPSVSHYWKTKYGDKIAPCGRKKWLARYPSRMYLSVFIRVICWRLPLLRMDFLRPQGAILYYILSSWCLPVGWWDCLLGALKAHEETSAHDYQGWLQARPIREDIKKYFYLLINWMNESIKPKGSEYDKVFWSYFSLPSCLLCDSLVIPM